MITGIVYNQWSNGVDRCFATGIVELYEDEGLTTLISSSPMALGVYTLPNIPNYSNRIVYLVVRNSLGDVVYQNQFTFYSDPYGNQIDYTDLNIFVNDTSAITCNPNYLQDAIVCSFYLIRKPCTNIICVISTSSFNYNYVAYTFYYGSTTENKSVTLFGDNACFNYGDCIIGNYLVCQTLRLYDVINSSGCCGNTTYTGTGEILEECSVCEEFELGKRLPEVSFVIENQCCDKCPCYEVDTPITFTPIVKFNLTDCCIGTTPQPCLIPPSLTFIKEDIFMYDKPYTMPVDSFVVDDLSFPQYDRVYKVGLKFELDVPCLCTNDDRIVIRSVPFTYNYIPNDFNSNLVAPFRAYYILDDNTPLYFGALTDSNINTFEIVPSVGNQDIDFDLYFLFNSEGKNRQNISFRFEVFYCGEVIGVEVIQTIQIDDDGNLVYSQLVTIS
jgi:hypothetical protein